MTGLLARAARASRRISAVTANDRPPTAGNDSAQQFARLRIEQERFLAEGVFDFELANRPCLIRRFVTVGGHRITKKSEPGVVVPRDLVRARVPHGRR